jgi:hypothetical protein
LDALWKIVTGMANDIGVQRCGSKRSEDRTRGNAQLGSRLRVELFETPAALIYFSTPVTTVST